MRIFWVGLIVLFWVGCSDDEMPTSPVTPNPPVTAQSDSIAYLALGDSYTIGQSVGVNERYPVQLADALIADSFKIKAVDIVAQTGWTTANLQIGIDNATLRGRYDLVSLLIGVNNQFQGLSIETYKSEFQALLNQAIAFAGGDKSRVFVVSIPDYAFTPFGNGNVDISKGIDNFNAAHKAIVDSFEIQYFDITPISRNGLTNSALVASDGLHPSGEQYRQWVALMLSDVKTMLN